MLKQLAWSVADLRGIRGVQMHPSLAANNVFLRTYLHESSNGIQQQQPGTITHSHISSLLISRHLSRPRVDSRYSVQTSSYFNSIASTTIITMCAMNAFT